MEIVKKDLPLEEIEVAGVKLQKYEPQAANAFADGVYVRELFMKANTYVIGKLHKTEHFNTILKGAAYVMMNNDVIYIEAPFTFVSPKNTRKVLWVVEDMIWQTVHVNKDNIKDISVIEDNIISNEPVDTSLLLPPSDMIKIGSIS